MRISNFRTQFNPKNRCLTITCSPENILTVEITEGTKVLWSDDGPYDGKLPIFESSQQLLVVYALQIMYRWRWPHYGFDIVIPDDSALRLGIINRDTQENQLTTNYVNSICQE